MLLNASTLNAEPLNSPAGGLGTFLRGEAGAVIQAQRILGVLSASLEAQSSMSGRSTVYGTIRVNLFARALCLPFPTYAIALTRADLTPVTTLSADLTPLIKGSAVLSTFTGLEAVFSNYPVLSLSGESGSTSRGTYVLGQLRADLAGSGGLGIQAGGRVIGSAVLVMGSEIIPVSVALMSGQSAILAQAAQGAQANYNVGGFADLPALSAVISVPNSSWNGAAEIAAISGAIPGAARKVDVHSAISALSSAVPFPGVSWKGLASFPASSSCAPTPTAVKDALGNILPTRAVLVVFSGIQFFGQETTVYALTDETIIPYLPDETDVLRVDNETTIYLQ